MATGTSNQGIADALVITRAGGREVRVEHLRQARASRPPAGVRRVLAVLLLPGDPDIAAAALSIRTSGGMPEVVRHARRLIPRLGHGF